MTAPITPKALAEARIAATTAVGAARADIENAQLALDAARHLVGRLEDAKRAALRAHDHARATAKALGVDL
jgi:hypothetical protein